MDPQPGPSKPVKPHQETVHNTLKEFIVYFVNAFKSKLNAYKQEEVVEGTSKTTGTAKEHTEKAKKNC